MMKRDRVRVYGEIVNTWTHTEERCGREIELVSQYEIAYKEYSLEDGSIVGIGTEDFSADRYEKEFRWLWVWTWDGHKLNRGGHRWFDLEGAIKFNQNERKEIKEYLQHKYSSAKVVQLRA